MFRKKYLSKSMMIIMRGNDHQKLIGKEFMVLEDCHQFYGYNRSMSLLDNGQIFVSSL